MSEEFSREITKQAVARACTALDYKNIQLSAVESLADVVRNYVECIGEHTRDIAENSGRAIPGIQDVISSLDTMVTAFV
jgi:histone H3/H4